MIWMLGPERLIGTYVKSPEALKSEKAVERLIQKYGLDRPAPEMYVKWLGNVLKGDFGYSNVGRKGVLESIMELIPYTFELAIYALIPVVVVGIWLGVKAGANQNKPLDHGIRVFAIIGWSLPDYVFGLIVLLVFYSFLGWFPPGYLSDASLKTLREGPWTHYTHFVTLDAIFNWRFDILWDALRRLAGPLITLSYLWWAYILRITRSSMLEVLRKDYVRTARAKGLSENVVINKHVKRNALIPVATVSGGMIVQLFAGTVIVETIFARPGLGRFTATSAVTLDYFSIIGAALFFSLILIITNLIVDISYALIDPRIRLT
jgi:peptide/nickel transport system permease protein